MARPPNTARRRAEIVRALKTVMARHGWEGASIARIAREAGLAPGLLHYHFADKREILLALMDALDAQLPAAGGRIEPLVDACLALGPGADPEAAACWTAIFAESVRDPIVRRRLRRSLRRLTARIDRLLRAAGRPGRGAAAALTASIAGCFMVASAAPGLIPRGSAASQVKRMAGTLA